MIKIEAKTVPRSFFEILERSGRMCFFDVSGDRKRSAQNPILWAETGAKTIKIARPGGMRGASGEVRRGLEPLQSANTTVI